MFITDNIDDVKNIVIEGEESQPDYVEFLKRSADSGDITAHYYLGVYYEEVEHNDLKAFEHFQKAADAGMSDAQNMLYLYYYWGGDGIPIDKEKAFKWIEKSANQGNKRAQYLLGRMYLEGQYVEKDLKKAFDLLIISAENGYAMAAFDVGVMYKNGEYVEADYAKAIEWIEKSAKLGFSDAQYAIGLHYLSLKDIEKALDYFNMAAKQGNLDAKREIENIQKWELEEDIIKDSLGDYST